MKPKYIAVAVVILLTVVLIVRMQSNGSAPETVSETPSSGTAIPTMTLPQKRAEQLKSLQGPRDVKVVDDKVQEVSQECKDLWRDLMKLDFSDKARLAGSAEAMPDATRCQNLSPQIQRYQDNYKRFCSGKTKETEKASAADRARACLTVGMFYRSAVVDLMTENEPLANISDPRILTDKLFSQFEANPENSVKVAERLLEVDPTNFAAAEMSVMAQLFVAENAQAKAGDARWEAAERSLEKVKQLLPNAPQTHELDIFVTLKKTQDPDTVRTKAQALEEKFPQSHIGPYYQAWAEFKAGNKKLGESLLAEAKKRAPNNPNVQKAPPFSAPFATMIQSEYGVQ